MGSMVPWVLLWQGHQSVADVSVGSQTNLSVMAVSSGGPRQTNLEWVTIYISREFATTSLVTDLTISDGKTFGRFSATAQGSLLVRQLQWRLVQDQSSHNGSRPDEEVGQLSILSVLLLASDMASYSLSQSIKMHSNKGRILVSHCS